MEVVRIHAARSPRRAGLGRRRARRDADRLLRASDGRWEAHPAVAWRVAELTSARERRVLARSLRGVARDAKMPGSPLSASPLKRRGVQPYADEIAALARRLGDPAAPVSAAGVVLVRDLLCEGGSPLYTGGNAADLAAALDRITGLL